MAYRLIDEEIGISELEGMVHECSSYDDSLEEYYYYESELMDNQEEIVERYAEMLEDNSVSEFKHLFEEVEDDE